MGNMFGPRKENGSHPEIQGKDSRPCHFHIWIYAALKVLSFRSSHACRSYQEHMDSVSHFRLVTLCTAPWDVVGDHWPSLLTVESSLITSLVHQVAMLPSKKSCHQLNKVGVKMPFPVATLRKQSKALPLTCPFLETAWSPFSREMEKRLPKM